MTDADHQRLRALVLADPDLVTTLDAIDDAAAFTEALLGLAAEAGLDVGAGEVAEALTAGDRRWIERWL